MPETVGCGTGLGRQQWEGEREIGGGEGEGGCEGQKEGQEVGFKDVRWAGRVLEGWSGMRG